MTKNLSYELTKKKTCHEYLQTNIQPKKKYWFWKSYVFTPSPRPTRIIIHRNTPRLRPRLRPRRRQRQRSRPNRSPRRRIRPMPRTTPRHRPEFYIGINRSFKNHMFLLQPLSPDQSQAKEADQELDQDSDPYLDLCSDQDKAQDLCSDQDTEKHLDLDQHSIYEKVLALMFICLNSNT